MSALEDMAADLADDYSCFGDAVAEIEGEAAAFGDGPPGSALKIEAVREALREADDVYLAVQGLLAWADVRVARTEAEFEADCMARKNADADYYRDDADIEAFEIANGIA